ncbi:MAG: sulfatase [Rikenellaceae bacterium]
MALNSSKLKTAVALTMSTAMSTSVALAKQPNVLLLVVDDMGWTDTHYSGSDLYQTPNIDALSRDGVIFTNGYAACTVSSPSRAALMTGKYPATLHITDWIEGWKMKESKLVVPDWTMYLPDSEVTMAEIFQANGYSTTHIGKWHLGENPENWPENHGFDQNIGGWAKGSPNKNTKSGYNGYFTPYGNPRLEDGGADEFLSERLAKEACEYIEEQSGDIPFFLNMWFYGVHTPIMAREEKIEKYRAAAEKSTHHKNPTYAALVEHVDDAVGEIIDKLKEEGLYENTIIIFTSDNGGLCKDGKITSNYPLRSGKGDIYEGGVRVPLIIKNAGRTIPFTNDHTPLMSIDILPTVADLAGLSVDKGIKASWDGVSGKPLLKSAKADLKRESIIFHYPHYHIEGATPYSAIRRGDWKLIHIMEQDRYELYDLKNDISESRDLSGENPQLVESLRNELESILLEKEAQMPTLRE